MDGPGDRPCHPRGAKGLPIRRARRHPPVSRDALLLAVLQRVNRGGTPLPALATSVLLALALILSNTFSTVIALLTFLFVSNHA